MKTILDLTALVPLLDAHPVGGLLFLALVWLVLRH